MGCGHTLFVDEHGKVRCSDERCPDSLAVHKIIQDEETEHIVELKSNTFRIKHPLRERLNDELLDCQLGEWLQSRAGPPERPGRYRVTRHQPDPVSESRRMGQGPWDFERLEDSSDGTR